MRSRVWSILLLGAAVGLVALAGGASGATKCVNPTGTDGCFSTIPAALAAAAVDDSIVVFPGIYHEAVTIAKRVTLVGRGVETTVISPSSGGNAVTFVTGSSGAKIVGFTIEAPAGDGVYSYNAPIEITIENCLIRNCSASGISFNRSDGVLRIRNCILYDNTHYGAWVWDGTVSMYGNVICSNHAGGILFSAAVSDGPRNEYNCLYGNTLNYADGARAGIGDIALDPLFVDAPNGDFHLQPGSPCIDTGRPGTSYLDCDGTRNDMGIYGGQDAYCGPGPVVTSLQLVPATVVKGQTFKIKATAATR